MGIRDGKKVFPVQRCDWFEYCKSRKRKMDAANVLFTCALAYPADFAKEDYRAALSKFYSMLELWKGMGLKLLFVFDGQSNAAKAPEDERRRAAREATKLKIAQLEETGEEPGRKLWSKLVKNTPAYILACTRICKQLKVEFIVAPGEADSQLAEKETRYTRGRRRPLGVVSADSDMVALGVEDWVSVDQRNGGWYNGKAWRLQTQELNARQCEAYPFVAAFLRHGTLAAIFNAALRGCDFSTNHSGVMGVGAVKAAVALCAIEEGQLTSAALTTYLRAHAASFPQMCGKYREE